MKDAARPPISGRAAPKRKPHDPSASDGLHWCRCSGRIVFLDVAADRYFCLPSIANDPFMKVASGSADRRDTERLAMLTKGGILADTEGFDPFPQPAAIGVPTRDILGKLDREAGCCGCCARLSANCWRAGSCGRWDSPRSLRVPGGRALIEFREQAGTITGP